MSCLLRPTGRNLAKEGFICIGKHLAHTFIKRGIGEILNRYVFAPRALACAIGFLLVSLNTLQTTCAHHTGWAFVFSLVLSANRTILGH